MSVFERFICGCWECAVCAFPELTVNSCRFYELANCGPHELVHICQKLLGQIDPGEFVSLSAFLSISQSISLSVCLSLCLSLVCPSVSASLSLCLFVCLSVSVCLCCIVSARCTKGPDRGVRNTMPVFVITVCCGTLSLKVVHGCVSASTLSSLLIGKASWTQSSSMGSSRRAPNIWC